MNTMNMIRKLAPLALLALPACSSDMTDLEGKVASVKAEKSNSVEPIPQIKQYAAFSYAATERRDPFAPAAREKTSQPPPERFHDNREPLEEFPLDALNFVGIVETAGKLFAMVRAPDKVIHRVLVRDRLGQNYGEISKITATEILITEIIPDGFGGWMQRPATLSLVQ